MFISCFTHADAVPRRTCLLLALLIGLLELLATAGTRAHAHARTQTSTHTHLHTPTHPHPHTQHTPTHTHTHCSSHMQQQANHGLVTHCFFVSHFVNSVCNNVFVAGGQACACGTCSRLLALMWMVVRQGFGIVCVCVYTRTIHAHAHACARSRLHTHILSLSLSLSHTHTYSHTHTVTLRRAELPSGASNVSLRGSDHDEVIVWGLGFKV